MFLSYLHCVLWIHKRWSGNKGMKKKTIEDILRECMLPIEIIGCNDPEIQLAHFKAMKEIYEEKNNV